MPSKDKHNSDDKRNKYTKIKRNRKSKKARQRAMRKRTEPSLLNKWRQEEAAKAEQICNEIRLKGNINNDNDKKLTRKCKRAIRKMKGKLGDGSLTDKPKTSQPIKTKSAQTIFKDIQSNIEEKFPEIRPYQHIPLYLIDTDKYDVNISAIAAYQCIRRNLLSLQTLNAERHVDQQLQEAYKSRSYFPGQ